MALQGWTHIKAVPGMGLEEQHCLRWAGAPVAVLKPAGPPDDRWMLSSLSRDAMYARTTIVISPLWQAKEYAERTAREIGWEPDNAHTKSQVETDVAEGEEPSAT